MGSLLSAGGKSQSSSGYSGGVLRALDKNLVSTSGSQGLTNTLMSQITEALRTGGIGAQLPIVQQAVSGAQQATSDTLRSTGDSLARSGLSRTPYGQSVLAGTRMQGAQQVAGIPTGYASQFIAQAPQFSSQLLQAILGGAQTSGSISSPYSH